MYRTEKRESSFRVWAGGELFAEEKTLRQAQKAYEAALKMYENFATDTVYLEKVMTVEIIRGRHF